MLATLKEHLVELKSTINSSQTQSKSANNSNSFQQKASKAK